MSDGTGRVLRFYGSTVYPLACDDVLNSYTLDFQPNPAPLMIPGTEPIVFSAGRPCDTENFIDAEFMYYPGDQTDPGYYEWVLNIMIDGLPVSPTLLLVSDDPSPLEVNQVIN